MKRIEEVVMVRWPGVWKSVHLKAMMSFSFSCSLVAVWKESFEVSESYGSVVSRFGGGGDSKVPSTTADRSWRYWKHNSACVGISHNAHFVGETNNRYLG